MAKEQRKDFTLTDDGDFPLADNVVNGVYLDTPYGLSDQQHIEDIIVYNLGYLKEYLQVGFSVYSYLNSENQTQIAFVNLKKQMEQDDYAATNKVIAPVNGGGFVINTKYIIRK